MTADFLTDDEIDHFAQSLEDFNFDKPDSSEHSNQENYREPRNPKSKWMSNLGTMLYWLLEILVEILTALWLDLFVIQERKKNGGKFFQFFPIYYLVMAVTLKRIQSSKKDVMWQKNKCNLHIMILSRIFKLWVYEKFREIEFVSLFILMYCNCKYIITFNLGEKIRSLKIRETFLG